MQATDLKPWDMRNNNQNVSCKMFIKTLLYITSHSTLHNLVLVRSTDRDVNKIYMKGKVILFTCNSVPSLQVNSKTLGMAG